MACMIHMSSIKNGSNLQIGAIVDALLYAAFNDASTLSGRGSAVAHALELTWSRTRAAFKAGICLSKKLSAFHRFTDTR